MELMTTRIRLGLSINAMTRLTGWTASEIRLAESATDEPEAGSRMAQLCELYRAMDAVYETAERMRRAPVRSGAASAEEGKP